MNRKHRYGYGESRRIHVTLYPEDDSLHTEARELADDMDISLSDLIWAAVDDYLTLHQHIVSGEVRRNTLAPDYGRTTT